MPRICAVTCGATLAFAALCAAGCSTRVGGVYVASPPPGVTFAFRTVDMGDAGTGDESSTALDALGREYIAYFRAAGTLSCATSDGAGGWGIETIDPAAATGHFPAVVPGVGEIVRAGYFRDGLAVYAERQSGTWARALVDSLPSADSHTSLAVDGFDNPHLVFRSGGWLGHAQRRFGSWVTDTVDASGDPGQWASLAVTHDGLPVIAYGAQQALQVRVATRTDTSWNVSVVDAGGLLQGASLCLDSRGLPHVAYCMYTSAGGLLRYATRDSAGWDIENVNPSEVGWYPQMVLDARDQPHLVYYEPTHHIVKYATRRNGVWVSGRVEFTDGSTQPSIALDPGGTVHVSYGGFTAGTLRHAEARVAAYGARRAS